MNATQTRAPMPPESPATASNGVKEYPLRVRGGRSWRAIRTSTVPQASRTRTRNGPMVAAENAPSSAKAIQRERRARVGPARPQLEGISPMAACKATAATAAPIPNAAPATQCGGWPARKRAARAMMRPRPGRMKQSPPRIAPVHPLRRQAQKIASWVDAGPGRRLVVATASSNSTEPSQPCCSTQSSRNMLMWVGGPPNPVQPMRPHSRTMVP